MDIKFIVLDVDGTLTDGKVYIGSEGEVFKVFDIKDGYGIKEILPYYSITPIIITARQSQALAQRCQELGIKEFHQGCRNKLEKLNEIIQNSCKNTGLANVAYIGDDFLDIECMKAVKNAGGLAICPNNAIEKIKKIADYVCIHNAGEGAVREFIDWLVDIVDSTQINVIKEYSEEAYNFVSYVLDNHLIDGSYKLNDGVIGNIMSYITKPTSLTCYESHLKYIDIQYIIYGEELMFIEDVRAITDRLIGDYDEEKDFLFYDYHLGRCTHLKAGDVAVLNSCDAHRGAITVDKPKVVRKIVFKVPVKN